MQSWRGSWKSDGSEMITGHPSFKKSFLFLGHAQYIKVEDLFRLVWFLLSFRYTLLIAVYTLPLKVDSIIFYHYDQEFPSEDIVALCCSMPYF
jgi:hypothetical protein